MCITLDTCSENSTTSPAAWRGEVCGTDLANRSHDLRGEISVALARRVEWECIVCAQGAKRGYIARTGLAAPPLGCRGSDVGHAFAGGNVCHDRVNGVKKTLNTAAELTRAAGPTWAADMPGVLAELTRRGDVVLGWDGCYRLPGGPSRDARGIRRRLLPRPGTAARRALA